MGKMKELCHGVDTYQIHHSTRARLSGALHKEVLLHLITAKFHNNKQEKVGLGKDNQNFQHVAGSGPPRSQKLIQYNN